MTNISYPIMSTDRFLEAETKAADNVRKRLAKPEIGMFKQATESTYPGWFLGVVIVALVLVMAFSFVVSAGKQVAAAGMVFGNLPNKYASLSTTWANASVIAMLAISELGAVLFLIAAGTLTSHAPSVTVAGREFKPLTWLFRTFAGLCACYAVTANVTITLADPVQEASGLQWLITISIPLLVLGLGVMLERLLIDALRARSLAAARYNTALVEYQTKWSAPETASDYPALLASAMWELLVKHHRRIIMMVEGEPDAKRAILVQEYHAHQARKEFSWEVDTESFLASTSA